ncbi:MAG: protein-L-isoaspartate(D-aspartate) O-methyltransferase [Deltaproteobacteria bacterium]|nr:protein-L-isoaspartate(D-aspartate) O-methyltransferase [Deltaproteobacteria bacterium]
MWRVLGVLFLLFGACGQNAHARPSDTDDRERERLHMVSRQMEARDIRNPRVLGAMRKVPRHLFVPEAQRPYAYDDRPLPIGHRQTISQPYIVALMTELAEVKPGDRVLEVGTGSGYQAAVLAEMGARVFSIEIVEPLAKRAKATLYALGYGKKVEVRTGDGYAGWPSKAPFDAIVVTAAPPKIPEPLKQQLKVGGHLVIPVGDYFQRLKVVTRTKKGFRERSVAPVRFVPMTGKAQDL